MGSCFTKSTPSRKSIRRTTCLCIYCNSHNARKGMDSCCDQCKDGHLHDKECLAAHKTILRKCPYCNKYESVMWVCSDCKTLPPCNTGI